MAKDLLTRAGVLSRVAELYDPCGWWEPLKVQMKLALQQFKGMEWTAPVPPDRQQQWIKLFQLMNQAKSITTPRCALPESVDPDYRIRLLTTRPEPFRPCVTQ